MFLSTNMYKFKPRINYMKIAKQILSITLILFTLLGCKQEKPASAISEKESSKVEKSYGLYFPEKDSISVLLNLDEYKTFGELLDRKKQIICSGRIPKIVLENDSIIRNIYFTKGICNEKENDINYPNYKLKNVIEIYDNLFINGVSIDDSTTVNTLKNHLQSNLNNLGNNPNMSESPERLVFVVYENKESNLENFKNNLLKITSAFDEIGAKIVLNIVFHLPFEIPPPPPISEKIEIKENRRD